MKAVDFAKKSSLMCACEKGHSAVVDMLLKAGANANMNACDEVRVVFVVC